MTEDLGGAKIYLKREDLNHTGSHKINNVLGQVLLAKRMGKRRLLLKPVPASMAWLPQPQQHSLIWSVKSSWAEKIRKGSR
jgi:hypothetical protein